MEKWNSILGAAPLALTYASHRNIRLMRAVRRCDQSYTAELILNSPDSTESLTVPTKRSHERGA